MLNIVVGIAVNFVSDAYSERMTSQKKPLKRIAEIESLLKNLKESLK